MANKFVTALKENKNDIRKKVFIVAGTTVAAVAVAVVLVKVQNNYRDVIFVPLEDAADTLADSLPASE